MSIKCQEGVKEVSSRVSLEGYLQEVVNDGLIGTEWEDKEETESRRRIKNS